MEEKIGVFICTGYGIGESLDLEAMSKVATEELGVPFCKTVASCEGPGLEAICQDITNESLTAVRCVLIALSLGSRSRRAASIRFCRSASSNFFFSIMASRLMATGSQSIAHVLFVVNMLQCH